MSNNNKKKEKPEIKICSKCGKEYIDPYSNDPRCASCFNHSRFIQSLWG